MPGSQPLFSCPCRTVSAAIPTYEEAMRCPLVEGPLTSPAHTLEEDLELSASGDALLRAQSALPPPSYESLILAADSTSGETTPGAASSCPSQVQTPGEAVKGS